MMTSVSLAFSANDPQSNFAPHAKFPSTNQTRAQERRSTVLGSLQAFPLGSAIRETIQKTTRASQVKPMTTQRNEPDSVEKKRGSHLKIPRNVGRTRTNDLFPTDIRFAHVNVTAYKVSAIA